MGKIRDEVEIWWNCLTKKQQKKICKKYYHCHGDYLSDMEYHEMEYLWINARDKYPIDVKKVEKVTRKIKLKKISENNL